jgi:prepilin-type N-terminal cleavage/methylation domain-containing protein
MPRSYSAQFAGRSRVRLIVHHAHRAWSALNNAHPAPASGRGCRKPCSMKLAPEQSHVPIPAPFVRRRKLTSRRAFSLLEMLVVVVLVGVVLTVSTRTILSVRRNAIVRGAIDTFIGKHSMTRATAVRYGRMAGLVADPAANQLWIEVWNLDGNNQWKRIEGSVTYFREVRFTTDRTRLCFDARGLAASGGTCGSAVLTSPDATVVFRQASRSDTVRTTLLGRVMR